jgi:flagellar biosynthetic protein FliR
MISFDFSFSQIQLLILLVSRASGIFVFTPFLGNIMVPTQVRIVLSVLLGYFLYLCHWQIQITVAFTMGNILIGMLGELAIGMVMGYAGSIVFAGLQFAAHLIGFQMGLSFVNTVDPTSSNRSTTLGILYNFIGLMLFVGFNGHHWFIETIAQSVDLIPPYGVHFSGPFVMHLSGLFGRLFVMGFQAAAPLVAVLLLTDVALGIVGRGAPQINILVIGFPLKVLVGLFCLGLGLYFLPVLFKGYSYQLYLSIHSLLQEMRQ